MTHGSLKLCRQPGLSVLLVGGAVLTLASQLSLHAALLSGTFTPLPAGTNVSLTAEGSLDWVHWGLAGGWSLERKYGVEPELTNTFLAPADKYENYYNGPFQLSGGVNPVSWSDGTPVLAVSNTLTGVYIYGGKVSGNNPDGFQIQCPADTTRKALRLYVGTSGIMGNFTAALKGATTYTDNSLVGATSNGVYTLTFQADSAGQVLTVTFASTDTSGYLALQAATLSGPDVPPAVQITAPVNGSVLTAPATFSLTATASDTDGVVTNLLLLNGSAVLAQASFGPLNVTLSNQPAGPDNFVAVAADNAGLSVTSLPVKVTVISGGGTLRGSVAAPPASLDLTAQGGLDWAHWGLNSGGSFDHKAGVIQWIPDLTPLNATTNDFLRYADNFTAYTWSDGTPTLSAGASTTGIYLYSTSQPPGAFELTVPATNTLRRLRVYVGLYGEQARMDAWLSDWSAVAYTDSSLSSAYHSGYALYTFLYQSTNAGATLNLRWSPAVIYDPFYGNVTWQAATLSLPPACPDLTLLSPCSSNEFNFSFPAEAGANYRVWYADSLSPTGWQVLTNFPGTGGRVTLSNFVTNATARFFRVEAQ